MRVDYKPSEGRIQYPNGSIIQALAGGANQIRGKTPSVYIGDEFAFQEEQDRSRIQRLLRWSRRERKLILMSTPNGSTNTFSTLWHGYPMNMGA